MDDYSRHTWIYLLISKSEVRNSMQSFFNMIETQFSTKIKVLRSDNGPEFDMPTFYATKGVVHQTSCVETPQQNGTMERKYQHILNVARARMIQSSLPKQYWSYSVLHVFYLINRPPFHVINNKTPYELMHSHKPGFQILKVFGTLCFASILSV